MDLFRPLIIEKLGKYIEFSNQNNEKKKKNSSSNNKEDKNKSKKGKKEKPLNKMETL